MENELEITEVKALPDGLSLLATVGDIVMTVPINTANRHYAEIMRQVEAGELTIQEAD